MTHPPGYVPRRALRRLDESYVGGVAAGLARHLGVPVWWVRGGFVALSFVGGLGVMLYAGLWLTLAVDRRELQPDLDDAPGLAAATRQGRRGGRARRWADLGPLVALAAIALGVVALVGALTGGAVLLWPVVLGVVGIGVLWRQADEAQRARWLDPTGRGVLGGTGWASTARVVAGVGLLLGAIVLFFGRTGDLQVATTAVVAALVAILGVALMIGPWLLQLRSALGEERAERIRSQERADVAAHLHDSVLQTLALIQKSAGDPSQVARLARAQERDLRSWLFSTPEDAGATLAGALREAAAEVEDGFGVPVEVVCVGDRPLPGQARALVLAAREAMVNAAQHSGAPQVDVYAENDAAGAHVFVRDRGAGFEPASVPEDRHGVRHSIVDRMSRHGGTAEVRSTPGSGTEVRLWLPMEELV
ncbi:ATP-binding protein [Nocardioides mangrovicus]|uniref:ATP-binding protein n=1 Tax=Nocardioides mangrovicus TaxID=2478913 RepID=A0A3L8NZJ0_9ACTN|nr:ATP-binding protein [Nocardioides mangrovicus]RLV48610.1 ATP-binding protein [Nocardioides mangrovicus]